MPTTRTGQSGACACILANQHLRISISLHRTSYTTCQKNPFESKRKQYNTEWERQDDGNDDDGSGGSGGDGGGDDISGGCDDGCGDDDGGGDGGW